MTEPKGLEFEATPETGPVSALWLRPRGARAALLLAHGAGADMHHEGMARLAHALADSGLASLRFQFPYAERGGRRPDRAPRLVATIRSARDVLAREARSLPLFAGGRSMGGRMTTLAQAEDPLPDVRGLVLFAFPLHATGKPGTERAGHLAKIGIPMLFVSGTRDSMAERALLDAELARLGPRAERFTVEEGDHGFRVPKRAGKSPEQVFAEIAAATRSFVDRSL